MSTSSPRRGVNWLRRCWKKVKGRFLFNEFALVKVFRARMLDGLNRAGLNLPVNLPEKRVVDCLRVGHGEPALESSGKSINAAKALQA